MALILLYARLLLQHLLAGPFRPQPAGGAGCQIVTDIGNQGKPDILLHEAGQSRRPPGVGGALHRERPDHRRGWQAMMFLSSGALRLIKFGSAACGEMSFVHS